MKHKTIFTADLHGYKEQYEALFRTALEEEAQSIIIGGDLAAKDTINPIDQKLFLRETLPSIVKDFKNKSDAKIYLILGNDDVSANRYLLEAYNGNLWNHIEGKRFNITPDHEIIGYPYIPISPFPVKDFEKFDIKPKEEKKSLLKRIFTGNDLVQPGASLEGETWVENGFTENGWTEGGWAKKTFDPKNIDITIEDDLNLLAFTKNPKETVYVFHCPPYDTPLDVIPSLKHVGSKAIKQFIEKNEPYLILTGHVHETVDVAKRHNASIGKSLAMTAGNGTDPSILSLLMFDLYNPRNTVERKSRRIN